MSSTTTEIEAHIDGVRIFRQEDWRSSHPWLVQGLIAKSPKLDFASPRSRGPDSAVAPTTSLNPPGHAWERLGELSGLSSIVRCSQVHGSQVAICNGPLAPGLQLVGEADALVTGGDDILLAITVADCIPIFLMDPSARVLGLAHAGWRGIAAGVIERTVADMQASGADLERFSVHLGPAICGACYEVGPEVSRALGIDGEPARVDLREVVGGRLVEAGIDVRRLTLSERCTRESEALYSYRGGDRKARMCAFLGRLRG